jgi:dTDP-4-amino-4,6-dideoxygalactose transaminase
MEVKFLDLSKQYLSIKNDIDEAIHRVLESNAFIRGEYVDAFEKEFAQSLQARNALGVGNGTDALFIALKTLGVGPGDEVITAANSFIASAEAISLTGARVVFADCDPDYYCIDPESIRSKVTAHTKAIVPVHLYGHPADMESIMAIAKQYNLFVVEDAAQGVFAEQKGIKAGNFGHFSCFSFYPGKNLGAYGDAGAIVSNDDALFSRAKMFANHGRIDKYNHEFEGINSRMDGIQGAVLGVKLPYLRQWTEGRRRVARLYNDLLSSLPEVTLPVEQPGAYHVYHMYVIRVREALREELLSYLAGKGIEAGVHYPIALPLLKAYQYLGYKHDDFPVAEKYSKQIISLPMFPELTEAEVRYVADTIHHFFRGQ